MISKKKGEIILKEKYGSSTREVTYIKYTDTNTVTINDNKKKSFLISKWISNIFLPRGYPESVSKDYTAYQIWDTLQAFCSTITGILATQEVLRGVGVGSDSATPLAATITWVIKDGCGHIGRIVFATTHGTSLDSYSKKWRWYADILNDAAMCLELGLPLMKKYTTIILCCSTVMRAIVGVAGGATRAAMTQHHATRGNLADVSAKDSAQETIVNLVASITALLLITTFKDFFFLNLIFVILIMSHVVFNYKAVKVTCLRTFNEPRLLQTLEIFLINKEFGMPDHINDLEPIVFHNHFIKTKLKGFQIRVGCSVSEIIKDKCNIDNLISMRKAFKHRNYVLLPNLHKKIIYIALKEQASSTDILCSYFHSILILLCTFNSLDNIKNIESHFFKLCKEYENQNSLTQITTLTNEIFLICDKLITENWHILSNGLEEAGWDLTNHLLIVDEWRICGSELKSADNIDEEKVNLQETKKDL